MYKMIHEASDLLRMDFQTFRIQDREGEIYTVLSTEPFMAKIGVNLRDSKNKESFVNSADFRRRGFVVIPHSEMEYDEFEESP